MVEYNEEERYVLRLANEFREMEATSWWKEFKRIVEVQISTRERLVMLPLSERNPAFEGMDFTTRAASLETIKGAIIGLRLALSIPAETISHATDIVKDHSGVDEDG